MKVILALVMAFLMQAAVADMVVVANPKVAADSLTRTQLARIFLGQTGSFPDGSAAIPLDVNGDFRNSFYTFMLKRSPTQMEKYWARMIFTGASMPPREVHIQEVKSLVAETRGAISYIDRSTVDGSVKIINIVDDK
jgi:ABC-type phosphate transport system substrate-binding protein